MMTKYNIVMNNQFQSLEIYFEAIPSVKERDILKGLKFRWHNLKKCWYGKATKEAIEKALKGEKVKAEPKTKEVKKVGLYGVKVGDIFEASWGYEQTNVDFFQVVELVGEKSARIVEVAPDMVSESYASSMSRDAKYDCSNTPKPRVKNSVFIHDQEKGDLKRIKNWGTEENPRPVFDISSFATATKYEGETVYESWYY